MIGENHSEPHGNLVKEWYLWTIGDGVRFERISKKKRLQEQEFLFRTEIKIS